MHAQQVMIEKAISRDGWRRVDDHSAPSQKAFDVQYWRKRATGKRKQAFRIRKLMSGAASSRGSHGACAQGGACFMACREASKIKRVRLKASESVSLISKDLAVLGKPKAGARLSCLRAWVALRLSAYDCLPMRNCQVSEPTCISRASRMEPSGSVSAVLKENPSREA